MGMIESPKTKSSLFTFSKNPSSLSSSVMIPSIPPSPLHQNFSETMMEENIHTADTMITKWDSDGASYFKFLYLFQENRQEAKEFIKCVKDLRRAMHFLVANNSGSSKLVLAQRLMQIAMRRLEKEFFQMLTKNRQNLDPESVSSRSRIEYFEELDRGDVDSDEEIRVVAGESISVSELAMADLKSIADCMISSGYGRECIKIYRINRKSIVDEGLYHLGVEKYNSSQINKMNSQVFAQRVKKWLHAARIAVKTLFRGEKFLCDHVFSVSDTIRESCAADILNEGAINLFRFPELVAKSNKRTPDKIFLLMDLHESLSDLWPEIESIFLSKSTATAKVQALSSLQKVGEAVRTVLSEFESSIQKNSSKTLAPGGDIHPLTTKVMDYILLLCDYSGVLTDIVAESKQSPLPESYFNSPTSDENPASAVLSRRLAWMILVLLCKLDSKAELYNDIALSYIFLANNLQFVVEKVSTTKLKYLLGDEWIVNHERKVKVYAGNYEAMAWNKVFMSLVENSDTVVMLPETVKLCFRQFNLAFEEAYRKQTSWVVSDGKLRDEIKVSIAQKLVPTYRAFYDTHFGTLSGEKNLEVLVRFAPDNLENYLSDLFHGTTAVTRRSSSSSLLTSTFILRTSSCIS